MTGKKVGHFHFASSFGTDGIPRASVLIAILMTFVVGTAIARKTPSKPKPPEPLTQFVEKNFAHWDRDHNDILELSEVDHLIEQRSVRGRQAALVVCLRYHMTNKANQPSLPHKQLLKLLEEHNFVKSVEQTSHRLETINRELFLPTDPDLTTFQQGRLGDCYLLSVIAALLHRSPNVIREMIHPEVTGGFQVVFGDGQKIQVAPLTDSELLLGAKLDNRHGSWLAVLEKAYGIIRKRDREKEAKRVAPASSTVPVETLDSGDPGVIISLMTGHHAESLRLGKAADANQVHNLLTEMAKGKRLMCASANNKEKPPPGMVNRHIYAILGYDAKKRQLTIFNPWGNSFNPKGPPGLENGYATKSGEFTVPLDQFEKVFSVVVYETDRWLPK